MQNWKRNYSKQMWNFQRRRDHVVGVDIYLISKHKMNRGKLQMVFNWMRSGEWLSTVMAQELWKMDASKLRYYIHQLKRRGYGIESETHSLIGVPYIETFTQYRLTTWKPEGGDVASQDKIKSIALMTNDQIIPILKTQQRTVVNTYYLIGDLTFQDGTVEEHWVTKAEWVRLCDDERRRLMTETSNSKRKK